MKETIVALDLGTSKSVALAAQKDHSGRISLLNTESIESPEAMRRGRIYNSDKTIDIISKLVRKMNLNLPSPIDEMYVGIGGQSLRTRLFSVKKAVEGGSISPSLLDSLREEANRYEPELKENLGVVSVEYYADGQLVQEPKGTMASVIEARFQIIEGDYFLKQSLKTVFSKKDVDVADYFISPLATAEVSLTTDEKKSGCALVEIGDGITYVSIYKNGSLKCLVTLPLGGLAITKDIRCLNVSEEEAEVLKIKYGSAVLESTDNEVVTVNDDPKSLRKVELKELNGIVEARINEIVKNIWNQIQVSGYSQTIDAGIVITGGSALLKNLPAFIRNQTGIEVRLANPKVWKNGVETQISPANSCVLGLVSLGKENCLKEKIIVEKIIPQPATKPTPISTVSTDQVPRNQVGTKIGKKIKTILYNGLDIFKDEDFEDNINDKK